MTTIQDANVMTSSTLYLEHAKGAVTRGNLKGQKPKEISLKVMKEKKRKKKQQQQQKATYFFSKIMQNLYFFNILLLIGYLCVGVCRCFQTPGCQSPLELKLLEVVSPLMWKLGTELRLCQNNLDHNCWAGPTHRYIINYKMLKKINPNFWKCVIQLFFLLKTDETEIIFWLGYFINQVMID